MQVSFDKANQYGKFTLDKCDLDANPFTELNKWINRAIKSNQPTPNGMSLVTVSESGQPSIRTVLLKFIDEKGLIFFTNYKSKKSREIEFNPQVAIKLYWPVLEQQLIVQGKAEKISNFESLKYFISRPAGSQIGAWCSDQTEQLLSREVLVERFKSLK